MALLLLLAPQDTRPRTGPQALPHLFHLLLILLLPLPLPLPLLAQVLATPLPGTHAMRAEAQLVVAHAEKGRREGVSLTAVSSESEVAGGVRTMEGREGNVVAAGKLEQKQVGQLQEKQDWRRGHHRLFQVQQTER